MLPGEPEPGVARSPVRANEADLANEDIHMPIAPVIKWGKVVRQ
jgi:hypothetical protein